MPAQILPTIDNPVQDAAQFAQSMSNFALTMARLKQSKLESVMAQSQLDTQTLQQQLLQANLERAKMENSEYQNTLKDRVQTTVKTLQATGGKADLEIATNKLQMDNVTQQAQQEIDFNTMKLADSFNRMLMNDPGYATLAQDELNVDQRIAALQQQMALVPDGPMKDKLDSTLSDLMSQKAELGLSRKAYIMKAAKPYPSLTSIMAPKVEGELSPTTQPSEEGKVVTTPPQPIEGLVPINDKNIQLDTNAIEAPSLATKAILSAAGSEPSTIEAGATGPVAMPASLAWNSTDIKIDRATGKLTPDYLQLAKRFYKTNDPTDRQLEIIKNQTSKQIYSTLSDELDRMRKLSWQAKRVESVYTSWRASLEDTLTEAQWNKLEKAKNSYTTSLRAKFAKDSR